MPFNPSNQHCRKLLLLITACCFFFSSQAQNNCLNFDGIGDEVDCGGMTQIDNVSEFTYEAWVKLDSWTNFAQIIGKTDNATSQTQLLLGGVSGRVIGLVGNGTNAQGWTNSTTALPLNTWTHIAVVYDGSGANNAAKLKIYVNGTNEPLIFQNAIPATTATVTDNFHICRAATTISNNVDGQVDEVRVWTTALSAATIDAWNNIPVTSAHPDYTGLVAYYMMDDPATPLSLADSVGTANGAIFDAVYNANDNVDFCYPPNISDVVADPGCYNTLDGDIAVTTTGLFSPYTYDWNTGSQLANLSGVGAGNYQLTITDSWGCEYDRTYTLVAPPTINVFAMTANVECFGDTTGSISAAASGGSGALTYVWSNSQSSSIAAPLVAGQYGLTVTDSTGCTFLDTFDIFEPTELVLDFTDVTDVTCIGGSDGSISVAASGGIQNYAYQWSDITIPNGTTTANNLPEGPMSVLVIDQNGCELVSDTVVDYQFELPIVDLGPDVVTSAPAATLSPGPQFSSYLWSYGAVTSTVTIIASDIYWVECTDSNGCVGSDTVSVEFTTGINTLADNGGVSVYPNPAVDQVTVDWAAFNVQQVTISLVDVAGRTLQSQQEVAGSISTVSLNGLAPGTYYLMVSSVDKNAVIPVIRQ